MKRNPVRKAATVIPVLVVLPFVIGCASQEEDNLAGIARAIAPELDSLNGLPTAVLDEYRCHSSVETCRERDGHVPASPMDATAMATGFADARGIPVVRYEDAEVPECPWREGPTAQSGLWAEFVEPPVIEGGLARVELATGCVNGAAFEQVHEFVLLLDDGQWKVVRRRLISIT